MAGTRSLEAVDYPTSDGRPMAETDVHRDLMVDTIKRLQARYAADPNVYVSGNLLVFYVPGDRRRHLAPDVFVVKGVPKHRRDHYLIWQEGRGPNVVFEYTSKTTRDEDIEDKFRLYRDVLQVPEYYLFDPLGDYLTPPLQGYRLVGGEYVPIEPVDGRLPSEFLGLHLEQDGSDLRLYDPATGQYLLTPEEQAEREASARQQAEAERQRSDEARRQAEAERQRSDEARQQAEAERQRSEEARRQAEAEVERLRREIEALRCQPPSP
jgi:Uma2 family endonuclease